MKKSNIFLVICTLVVIVALVNNSFDTKYQQKPTNVKETSYRKRENGRLSREKLASEVFGKNKAVGNYLNDSDFIDYFVQSYKVVGSHVEDLELLYNVEEFDNTLKEITTEELFELLNQIEYVKEDGNETQDPTEILYTKEGNCSSFTLFIYQWLKLHKDPNQYRYYLEIKEEPAPEGSKYDGHIYIYIKPEGKEPFNLDIAREMDKEEPFKEFKEFLSKI